MDFVRNIIRRRGSPEGSKTIFLDTNILLHFKPINEIDWRKIFESEKVNIVIPLLVMQELDKHKYNPARRKIRERAKGVIRYFHKIEDDKNYEIRDGVEIEFQKNKPRIKFFKYRFDPEIKDNQILASILEYKKKYRKDATLVHYDISLKLIANRYGIKNEMLDEDHLIQEELDDAEKEVIKLRNELAKLKNALPSLKIVYEDNTNKGFFKVREPIAINKTYIEQEVERIKKEYPEEYTKKEFRTNLYNYYFLKISEDEYSRYNKEIREFFDKYRVYLEDFCYYQNILRLLVVLKLIIKNDGSRPANDIDIIFYFPDGLYLFHENDYPGEPVKPKPPKEPRTDLQVLSDSMESLSSLNPRIYGKFRDFENIPNLLENKKNVSEPEIKKTNGFEVKVNVKKLKHNDFDKILYLYYFFKDYDNAKSFNVEYCIRADNLPEVEKGKIHVIIEKENGNQENLPEEIH